MRRRQVLAAGAFALSAGVAGCTATPPPPDEPFDAPSDRWPNAGYDPAGTGHPPAGPDDAAESWTRRRSLRVLRSGLLRAPVVAKETVYVATLVRRRFESREGGTHLVALAEDTGEVSWSAEFTAGLTGGPALFGRSVVVGGPANTL